MNVLNNRAVISSKPDSRDTVLAFVSKVFKSVTMPSNLFSDMDHQSGIEDRRALQLAFELSMLGLSEPLTTASEPDSPTGLSTFTNGVPSVGLDETRSKKSQNMTECVPVPSSEHVAEIVGRQGKQVIVVTKSKTGRHTSSVVFTFDLYGSVSC